MRSVLDYSSKLISHLSAAQIRRLQAVQNKALRIIFSQKEDKSSENLHKLGGLDTIKSRFHKLNLNYFLKAIETNNPILSHSLKEFNRFANGRMLKYTTLLCPFKEQLNQALTEA